MKKNLRTVLLTASLALAAAGIPARSFEPTEPVPPPPPEDVAQAVAHAEAEVARPVAHAHQQSANQRANVEAARARVGDAHAKVLELAQAVAAPPHAPTPPQSAWANIRLGGSRQRGAGDTVVIRSSEPEAKSQAELEEDLAVMARVLGKAAAEQSGEERRSRAMSIDLLLSPATSRPRAFYLEDYGAVFLLNVPLQLLPPPEKTEPAKEKPESDAAWEQARRELYGAKPFLDDVLGKALQFEVNGETLPEYDAKKVDDLKEVLLGALKNARNIRGLKPEDAITLCVFGGPGGDAQRKRVVRVEKGDDGEKVETVTETDEVIVVKGAERAPARGSLLTIRVKKADVDAFAAGQLDLAALEKKAKIALYAGGTSVAKGPFSLDVTPY
jgi:hypothetical protein